MTIIFKVGKERFLLEHQRRRNLNKIDMVEWYVDDVNINFYIVAESRAYLYVVDKTAIPEDVRMSGIMVKGGEVLGIVRDKNTVTVDEQALVSQIKLQVNS